MAHLVARQTVEFIARDRRHAETLTARTSAAAPAMAAAIARVLDRFDQPDRRIRLDIVEIDLGTCPPARWEEALVAGIERELGASLRAALAAPEPGAEAPAGALELMMVFARTGRLPWWAGAADLPGAAIAQLAVAGAAPEDVRRLLALPGAVERLVRQLDDGALATLLLLALLPAGAPVVAEARRLAGEVASHLHRASPSERREHWAALLRRAAQGQLGAASTGPLSGDAASHTPASATGHARAPQSGPVPPQSAAGSDEPRPQAALAARLEALALLWPGWSALAPPLAARAVRLDDRAAALALQALAGDTEPDAAGLAALIAALHTAGVVTRDEVEALHAAAEPQADPHDAIAIDCAGLTLLAPFLPAFFAGLDLVEDRAFRDEAARHRAIGLMHFLASGEPEAPEARLPLAKLLAGLPLDALHEPAPLSADDAAACDALLAAVIGHAPMLGRISPAGLRGSFLLRPGTLTTRDGHWLLRVERRSFDVLLDRLPWSFNWVRLPWMAASVQTEW